MIERSAIGLRTARAHSETIDPGAAAREENASLRRLSPSHELVFSRVAERNLLFSTRDQRVFEINDMAAYIWCSICEGCGHETIVRELASQGIPLETATTYLGDALRDWCQRGILKPAPIAPASMSDKMLFCQQIEVLGVSILVRYGTGLFRDVAPVFRHLQMEKAAPDVTLDVVEEGSRIELFRNGNWMFSFRGDELATVLKGQLLDEALTAADYELALHTATLVQDDRVMLLNGRPGAGKTTLTLALVSAGFGFAGDDVALLDSQGQVTGIPFSPACKAGAWKLVARYQPEINNDPVFHRCDRRRVRYPAPRNLRSAIPRPVGWVIFLDRQDRATTALTRIDPIRAMQGMLRESCAQGRRLTAAGFTSLLHAISHAECYQLTYYNLEDAVDLLCRTCQ